VRYSVTFSLLFILVVPAAALDQVRDVPQDHWANESVGDLIRMGVTKGYPDGTFRGTQEVTRFETAVFLSKLAGSFGQRRGVEEKLLAELGSEVALLKYERERGLRGFSFSGEMGSACRVTSTAPRGGRADYRLKFDIRKKVDDHTSLKLGLDTVDAGYNTDSSRPLATRLLDVESRFRLGGMDYKVNLGPGVVVHTDNLFPSDNYTIYIRPKTAVKASTRVGRMDLSASYVTRQVETSGRIGVHELTAYVKYKYGDLAVHFRPRYLFILDGPRDVLAEGGFNLVLARDWETYFLLGVGDFQAGSSGMYVKVIEKMLDPWKTGTTIVLRFDQVGSKYRREDLDEYEFCYLNNFNRLILDGTADLGLKIGQRLTDKLSLEWQSDCVTTVEFGYGRDHPGTYFIWQLGGAYELSGQLAAKAFYRSYNVPSGVAQFSDPVPTVSDVFGVGLNCRF